MVYVQLGLVWLQNLQFSFDHSGPEALGQPHSPHLTFQSSHPGASHSYRSAGVHR